MTLKNKWTDVSRIVGFIRSHPLASLHFSQSIIRVLVWQLSQLYPHEKQVKFVHSTKFWAKKGWTGVTGNIYSGLHDFSEMGFLLHFLRKDDLFIDAGANAGSYTILAAGVAGAYVLAFEPGNETFQRLQNNITLNKLESRVTLYNIGLGSEEKTVLFSTRLDTVNHIIASSSNYEAYSSEIKLTTLDNVLKDHENPLMIKIDVEGFEAEVLMGMRSTLLSGRLKAIIIELNSSGMRYGFDDDIIDLNLRSHGFEPFDYDPLTRLLSPLKHFTTTNTIYIRDKDFVFRRLKEAKKVTILNQEF